MKSIYGWIALIVLPFYASHVEANEFWRKVVGVSCRADTDTCWASVDGSPVSSNGNCASNEVYFATDTVAGRNILALLTTAHATGKPVLFRIAGCSSRNSLHPQPLFVKIAS